jgi:hypothetical protein
MMLYFCVCVVVAFRFSFGSLKIGWSDGIFGREM